MQALEQQLKPLMLLGLAGDAAAQRRLLGACAERLTVYFTRRMRDRETDVEDLVQETLIAIHQRRASYDPARPFTVWLHAVARYKLMDHLRSHYRHQAVPLDDVTDWLEADEEAASPGSALDVERLLDGLPDAQRQAITLTKIDGLTVAETAARTGQSESNIKVLVHRGMKALMTRKKDMEQ